MNSSIIKRELQVLGRPIQNEFIFSRYFRLSGRREIEDDRQHSRVSIQGIAMNFLKSVTTSWHGA